MPAARRGPAAPIAPAAPSAAPVAAPARRPDAHAYRRAAQEGELFTLPGSGHLARLRRPSLMDLATRGTVPNPLANEVLKLIAADTNPAELSDERRVERWLHNARAFIEIAAICFVAPRLILDRDPDYDAGEIAPGDISDLDYIWLYYTYVEGVAEELAPFRCDP